MMDLAWVENVANGREWTDENLSRLHQTVKGIGRQKDCLLDGGLEFLSDSEQGRLADYLLLTDYLLLLAFEDRQPRLRLRLRTIREHLQRLLQRHVPVDRQDQIHKFVAEGLLWLQQWPSRAVSGGNGSRG